MTRWLDEDADDDDDQVIRSFIVTQGRTIARSAELPIETLVKATPQGRLRVADLQFEARRIVTEFQEPTGIAEISALLQLPLRTTQILVSELVADGALAQYETARRDDIDLLLRIRSALLSR